LQQVPLGGGEADVGAVPVHPFGGEIDGEPLGLDDHVGAVRSGRGGAADGGAQPGEQLVHAEGLGDVVVRARVQGLDLLVRGVAGGEHEDRDPGPAAQALDDLDAVHVRQPQVEDDHVGMVCGGELQRGGPVVRRVHLVRAGLEIDHQGADDLGFVVDHEHPGHAGPPFAVESTGPSAAGRTGGSGRSARCAAGAAGRLSTMVRPPPGVSSATRLPPIASTNPRATARPRPTPVPRAEESPSRWKGSKMRSLAASGTPGPRSTTRSSTRPPSVAGGSSALPATRTFSGPPYLTAFSTRLATARSSSPGSATTMGSVSWMSSRTEAEGTPCSATGTTSSRSNSRSSGVTVPVCRRLMSRRLPMRWSRRSAPSSMPASS